MRPSRTRRWPPPRWDRCTGPDFEGHAVVVKIQRPDIRQLLEVDLAALRIVVAWLKRYRPVARRADLDALVAEFSRTLWAEVDYLAEAEHARRFAAMFAGDAGVCVPRVYDERTTRSVLTLEDVYAIKITDYAAIEAAGISRAEVAQRLFRTYMHQIFEQGFFHADPHPGNLFVEPNGAAGWRLVFVDFGMVGQVSDEMRQGLRDLAIGLSVPRSGSAGGGLRAAGHPAPGDGYPPAAAGRTGNVRPAVGQEHAGTRPPRPARDAPHGPRVPRPGV